MHDDPYSSDDVAPGDEHETENTIALRPPEPIAIAAPPASLTPAQGKVDAIANLTFKAYERASMLEMTDDEINKLTAYFPDEAFRRGAAGKNDLIYIEHAFLRDRFNEVFGPGRWSIIPRSRWQEQTANGARIYVEAMLVIRGCFVSESIGDMEYHANNKITNYGDAVEGAKTQAFRRCAKDLGVGLQAWKKSWCAEWMARNPISGRPQQPIQTAPAQPQQSAPKPQTVENNPVFQQWSLVAKRGWNALEYEWAKMKKASQEKMQPWLVKLKEIAVKADEEHAAAGAK